MIEPPLRNLFEIFSYVGNVLYHYALNNISDNEAALCP